MLQGCVARTCNRDQIAELAHLWKSCPDVFQGHVAPTHPLVCAGTFSLMQHEICAKYAPATCCTELNLLNFMGHVAGQILHKCSPATGPISVYLKRFCTHYILQQHVPATCPLVWAHLKRLNRSLLLQGQKQNKIMLNKENKGLLVLRS